jgi:tetratricopeptide (TPR) repeat protein
MQAGRVLGAIMKIRVLGTVELVDSGKRHDPGPDKIRCLLSILVLNINVVVPDDVIVERLWDDRPPAKARESLPTYVTRLRGALRHAGFSDTMRLERRAHGYVLEGDRREADIHEFRAMRQQARALSGRGELDRAVALLREADALWQGQALAGLPGDAMARLRRGLEEERRATLLERIDIERSLGRSADMIAELEQLSDKYPLDEVFLAHQMAALDESGRLADALAVYQAARIRLDTELGTEPGPALRNLQQKILRRREAGHPASEAGLPSAPDTLPRGPAHFVGRDAEIELLTATAGNAHSVWAVTGMPGAGKTALSVEAIRVMRAWYPDGQLFVSFRTHEPASAPADTASALHLLLTMLGMPAADVPPDLPQRAALWQAQLARRRMAVVLDDVPGLDQVRPLLPGLGRSLVLITARRQLAGIGPGRTLALGPLLADDAAELFIKVAGPAAQSASPEQITAAARLCGRLPLAIQLVASGIRRDGTVLEDVVEELSRPPASPGSALLPSPEVTAAFEHSYRTLGDRSRRLFRQLGLHPAADITMAAAAALGDAAPADTEPVLDELASHHLLERGSGAFHFHDLMRQYAGLCAARDETESTRRAAFGRLLDFYVSAAENADRILYPHARRSGTPSGPAPGVTAITVTRASAADWMELEWRNILSVARRAGEHERQRNCARLGLALSGFLRASGRWGEATQACSLALQACRDLGDRSGAARALLELSTVDSLTGEHEAAMRHAREAVAAYRSCADRAGEADAVDQIGVVHCALGRFREALAHHRTAADIYRATDDLLGGASTLNHIGIAFYYLGRYPGAVDQFNQALRIYRQAGDIRSEAKALNNLGKLQLHQGYYRDALKAYRQALEIFTVIGGEQNQAILHHNIGCAHIYREDYDQALSAYRQALTIYRRIGDLPGVVTVLNDTGLAYQELGYFRNALEVHQSAMETAERLGDSYGRVIALRGQADAYRGQENLDEAARHYQDALRLAREIDEHYQEGKALEGLAEIIEQTEGEEAARICRHQALDALEPLGVPEAKALRIRLGDFPADD